MDREFDTKGSMNYFRKVFIPLSMFVGFAIGIYFWYRKGSLFEILGWCAAGFVAGIIVYVVQWSLYGNVRYTITNTTIVLRRGDRVIRSIQIKDVDYYYFSKPETFPRVKVRGEKDFSFPMTRGVVHEIVATLEALGIKARA